MTPDLEKKFESYKKLLDTRGYFKDVSENTPAYAERLEKARGHFLAKYSHEQAPSSSGDKQNPKEPGIELTAEEKLKRAEAHKERGNELLQGKRYAEAIAEYSAALALHSHSAVYHANRALALQRVGRYEDAVRDCRAALAIDPQYVKAAVRLSQSLGELKRVDEALAALEETLALQPGNIDLIKARDALKPPPNPWANAFRGGGADGMSEMPQGMPPGMPQMPAGTMAPNGAPPNFMDMMTNPDFVRMAQSMVAQNPELMRMAENLMRDPNMLTQMFQNMPGGMGGAFPPNPAGGFPGPGDMPGAGDGGGTLPPQVPKEEQ